MKMNESPESFLIRDKDYSIISCSPETLILKEKFNKNKANSWYIKKNKKFK